MTLGYELNLGHRSIDKIVYPAHRLFGLIRST